MADFVKATPNVRAVRANVQPNLIPVQDRPGWLRSDHGKEYIDDSEWAKREDQGIDVDDDRRPADLWTMVLKRLYRLRRKITEQVAKEMTTKFGKAVSPRMVDRCWKEFRRDNQSLDD